MTNSPNRRPIRNPGSPPPSQDSRFDARLTRLLRDMDRILGASRRQNERLNEVLQLIAWHQAADNVAAGRNRAPPPAAAAQHRNAHKRPRPSGKGCGGCRPPNGLPGWRRNNNGNNDDGRRSPKAPLCAAALNFNRPPSRRRYGGPAPPAGF